MAPIDALILGIIQGLTEFFPVSSSAHLTLGQHFLGMDNLDQYIFFDLICHFGTLCAIVLLLWGRIKHIFFSDRTMFRQLFVATLPLFPLALAMKPIRAAFDQPMALGLFMMLNASILAVAVHWSKRMPREKLMQHRWRDTCAIGVAQACAVFPGISRSGSTLSTAWLLGWGTRQAVLFSFLLSIPAVLGGIAYELLKLSTSDKAVSSLVASVSLPSYVIGFFSSFIVGLFSLSLLIRLFTKEKFSYFVWYCLLVGAAVTIYTARQWIFAFFAA